MTDPIRWHTAAPLWDRSLEDPGAAPERFQAPVLLRFAGDDFMEELSKILENHPARLENHVARQETWQQPEAGWQPATDPTHATPITLYQPAHNRFYLVAASLVCRMPGLPDRSVQTAAEERAWFVLRRRIGATEYGWFGDRQQGVWSPLADPERLVAGEERLPLFPQTFDYEGGQRRLHVGLVPVGAREVYESGARTSIAHPTAADTVGDPLADPRAGAFRERILVALQRLETFPTPPETPPPAPVTTALENTFADQGREALVFALLDLAEFLKQELPALWKALTAPGPAPAGAGQALFQHLDQTVPFSGGASARALLQAVTIPATRTRLGSEDFDQTLATTLLGGVHGIAALRAAAVALLGASNASGEQLLTRLVVTALGDRRKAAFRDRLESWQNRLVATSVVDDDANARARLLMVLLELAEFLQTELAELWQALTAADSTGLGVADSALFTALVQPFTGAVNWRELLVNAVDQRNAILAGTLGPAITAVAYGLRRDQIETAAAAFFDATLAGKVDAALDARPPPRTAADATPAPDSLYQIRCVYQRPRCGRFAESLLSAPSRRFRLASYFDPDAPVRELRIRMPADTSVKGLRRFPKAVSILLSSKLRQQMARVQKAGLANLIDGKVEEESGGIDLGVICSFSLPIITICALILLMIIVQLLNIVFWWLPLFRICLPLRSGS